MTYGVETLTYDLISEMIPMQSEYWRETTEGFHRFPPDPHWKIYLAAQQADLLKVVCARADGVLKGAAIIVIMPDMLYACITASLPVFFLDPHYRGMDGIKLLKRTEEEAQKAGAQLLMTHGGIHTRVYRLFEGLNYDDFGRYFVKVLPSGPNGLRPVYKERMCQ